PALFPGDRPTCPNDVGCDQLHASKRQLLTSFPNLFILLCSAWGNASSSRIQEVISTLHLLRSHGAV
ncbi:hypothetical protein STEG23_024288, partial [Scotinomys teguina]